MAEVVNLRAVRKRAARAKKEQRAQQNRVAHSRTKADRGLEKISMELSERRLDGHRLERGDTK